MALGKFAKVCDGCSEPVGARFRAQPSLYLCGECWPFWQAHGRVPTGERELAQWRDERQRQETVRRKGLAPTWT